MLRFAPVPFDHNYRVDSEGGVWSRYVDRGHGKVGGEWRLLKQKRHPNGGHFYVDLQTTKDGARISKRFMVGRLVLECFVGPCPAGMQCCHFPDRDTANNRVENLRWGTSADNHEHQKVHGTWQGGSQNGNARLSEAQVLEIRRLYATGKKQRDLASQFGIAPSMVSHITTRIAWRHI